MSRRPAGVRADTPSSPTLPSHKPRSATTGDHVNCLLSWAPRSSAEEHGLVCNTRGSAAWFVGWQGRRRWCRRLAILLEHQRGVLSLACFFKNLPARPLCQHGGPFTNGKCILPAPPTAAAADTPGCSSYSVSPPPCVPGLARKSHAAAAATKLPRQPTAVARARARHQLPSDSNWHVPGPLFAGPRTTSALFGTPGRGRRVAVVAAVNVARPAGKLRRRARVW